MVFKTERATHEISAVMNEASWSSLRFERAESEREGSMAISGKIDIKIFNWGVYLERILAVSMSLTSFICLITQ